AARLVLQAEVAVVAQGPGNLGTGTRWGFSGVAVGEAVNAAAVLGGRPVGALRISAADPRERHRGVSHHSLTAYGRVALAAADLAVPTGLPEPLASQVRTALAPLAEGHRLVPGDTACRDAALRAAAAPRWSLGRGLAAAHPGVLAGAAAGGQAAALLPGPPPAGGPGSGGDEQHQVGGDDRDQCEGEHPGGDFVLAPP